MPGCSMLLKIILRGKTTVSSQSKSMWEEIPSEPVALFGFSERIRGVMSSVVNRILESLSFVKYERMGNILLFRPSEHCREKNWVNNVARKFEINLPYYLQEGEVFLVPCICS